MNPLVPIKYRYDLWPDLRIELTCTNVLKNGMAVTGAFLQPATMEGTASAQGYFGTIHEYRNTYGLAD